MKDKKKRVKDFYQTSLGKLMKIVEILGCFLIILGLGLAVFQGIAHAKNIVEQYQTLIEFGDSAVLYGVICLLANSTVRNDYYIKNNIK